VNIDRRVPIGFDVEADDDYDAVTVGWGALGGLFIAAMSPLMMLAKAAKRSVVGGGGVVDYKFMTRQTITVS
jgi:hypothetical protein